MIGTDPEVASLYSTEPFLQRGKGTSEHVSLQRDAATY